MKEIFFILNFHKQSLEEKEEDLKAYYEYDQTELIAALALELIEKSSNVINILEDSKSPIQIKIGFHTGLSF